MVHYNTWTDQGGYTTMNYKDITDIRDFKLFFRNNVMSASEADDLVNNQLSSLLQIQNYNWSEEHKSLTIALVKDCSKTLDDYIKAIYPVLDCYLRWIYSTALFADECLITQPLDDRRQSMMVSKMLSGDLAQILISDVKFFETDEASVFVFCF